MVEPARRRRRIARPGIESRSTVLFELRTDMVWIDAPGGRTLKAAIVGPFAGRDQSAGTVVQFERVRRGIRLPGRLTDESIE